ncbi:MAG: alpha/beta hydrolase [Aquabacterium sp.]
MSPSSRKARLAGASGQLECVIDEPAGASVGLAVLCHPHPQFGGTMDNKVVQTLARACVQSNWTAVRFNFRGVGGSGGVWDEGRGELADVLSVVGACRNPGQRLVLAGFSFGAAMAAQAAVQLPDLHRLILIGPAVSRFDLPGVREDTLVVHGERDDVVPLAAVLDWARPQTLPVVVMPGVGHFFHGQLTRLKAIVSSALDT